MRRKLAALLAVALLGAAGCGESAESDDPDPPPRGDEDVAVQAVEVTAIEYSFDPDTFEADPGQTIDLTFLNAGTVSHTFTIKAIDFDHEAPQGAQVKAAIDLPDEDVTLTYVCRFHEQMKGELVVGDGGSGAGGGSGDSGSSDEYDY